jgi:L-fuconolactonase
MLIIDSHCHASPYWFEPVETLIGQMDRNEVEKAVLVQFTGVFDNSYQLDCARRYPGRFSSIIGIDVKRPDAPRELEHWVSRGAEGVRLFPGVRSSGSDPLAIWRKARDLGIVVNSPGTLEQFCSPQYEEAIAVFPDLTFIIEHLGRGGSDKSPGRETFRKVLALARYPNTYMKVPGLGEFCERTNPLDPDMPFVEVPPLIEMALEAFGPKRLMWGSNFPPSAGVEGYANTLKFPLQCVKFASPEDKAWVFGKTAAALFKFR